MRLSIRVTICQGDQQARTSAQEAPPRSHFGDLRIKDAAGLWIAEPA